MVAATVDLEVGAAGKGRAHANDQFPVQGAGYVYLLQSKVFLAVQHRGRHLRDHPYYLLIPKGASASSTVVISSIRCIRQPGSRI